MIPFRTWTTDKVVTKGKPTDLWVRYESVIEVASEQERRLSLMFSAEDMKQLIAERNKALQYNFVYERALKAIADLAGVPFKREVIAEAYWHRFMQSVKSHIIKSSPVKRKQL